MGGGTTYKQRYGRKTQNIWEKKLWEKNTKYKESKLRDKCWQRQRIKEVYERIKKRGKNKKKCE